MIAENTTPNAAFNSQPKKFVTWLFVLSSLMCFAGLTSAYIVRKAEGNWKIFDLPEAFYYTTVLILLSSITLHLSLRSAKKGALTTKKLFTYHHHFRAWIFTWSIFCLETISSKWHLFCW